MPSIRIPRSPLPAATLAALAGVIAAPASADAATLKATVSGTQTTTWSYVKQQAPSCDWPEMEEGEQKIEFTTDRAAKLRVKVGKGGALQFTSRAAIPLTAKATLRRDYDRRYAEQTTCPGGGSSGAGQTANVKGTATCSIGGALKLRLGTTRTELYDAGDPAAPQLLTPKLKAGSALLRGQPAWKATGSWPFLPASCSDAGQPDADIAITEGRGEWSGALIETRAALPVAPLLKGTAKRKTVQIRATVDYPNADHPVPGQPGTKGRTELRLKLVLAR